MKAMILAAGRGERMRPLTDQVPKAMIKAAGKPLIQYHVENLVAAGIDQLVINHAHLGYQIVDFLGDGSQFGVTIQYSRESEALETGGGILKALPLLGEDPFVVINADVWSDYPLSKLLQRDSRNTHLVLVGNPAHNSLGDFNLAQDVVSMEDNSASERLTFSGISVLNPELFEGSQPGFFALLPILQRAIERGKVSGEYYQGAWFDVGTTQRLADLEEFLGRL